MDILTGADYLNRPIKEIVEHPDFSIHACEVMLAISKMTTKELLALMIIKGDFNG